MSLISRCFLNCSYSIISLIQSSPFTERCKQFLHGDTHAHTHTQTHIYTNWRRRNIWAMRSLPTTDIRLFHILFLRPQSTSELFGICWCYEGRANLILNLRFLRPLVVKIWLGPSSYCSLWHINTWSLKWALW